MENLNKSVKTDKDYMIKEYNQLLQCKGLGYYNCCEMISIFFFNKKEKEYYHFFSVFVLEDRIKPERKAEYLTDKFIPISSQMDMGIFRKVQTMEETEKIFHGLCQRREEGILELGDKKLITGSFAFVPKVFVQPDWIEEIPLNKVLKNNFQNGSYVLEFFDVEKKWVNLLKKEELEKAFLEIDTVVPISLSNLSDRIGNIIFQFPSINAWISHEREEEESTLNCHIQMDGRWKEKKDCHLIWEVLYDKSIVEFGISPCTFPEAHVSIRMGDAAHICRMTFLEPEKQLILGRQEVSFKRKVCREEETFEECKEERLIYDNKGGIIDKIPLKEGTIQVKENPWTGQREEFIYRRQREVQVNKLVHNKKLLHYGVRPEREKALREIRELMELGRGGKVYIWDPCLCVEDLLETWYYTKYCDVPLYGITSREKNEKRKQSVTEWIKGQREIMDKRSNHAGIRLELRCQWNGYGYPFQDRFLMVLHENEKPRVWSLGTSIYHLGKQHHMIQEVDYPKEVVDAFLELWERLSGQNCLVWKKGD